MQSSSDQDFVDMDELYSLPSIPEKVLVGKRLNTSAFRSEIPPSLPVMKSLASSEVQFVSMEDLYAAPIDDNAGVGNGALSYAVNRDKNEFKDKNDTSSTEESSSDVDDQESSICCDKQEDTDDEDDVEPSPVMCTFDSTAAAAKFEASCNDNKKRRTSCCDRNQEVKGGSALKLKNMVYGKTLMDFYDAAMAGCNERCQFGKKCIRNLNIECIGRLRKEFWGGRDDTPKLPSDRRASIQSIFSKLAEKDLDKLHFKLTDNTGVERLICEGAVLFILGYIDTPNASDANPQWKSCKANFMGGNDNNNSTDLQREIANSAKGVKKSAKYMHADTFIREQANFYSEAIPSKEGAGPVGEDGSVAVRNIKILPFESGQQLYREYCFHYDSEGVNGVDARAKKSLFLKVLKHLRYKANDIEIRLLGCKGSFPTCDICNTSNQMLRDKNYDQIQRDIILAFRRLHLKQQQNEREYLERVKERCRKVDSLTGMPLEAFIYSDAMTKSRGDTPKEGVRRRSNAGAAIQTRIFGVQVICGPIDFTMYCSVDQLQSGGANLNIEIQRLAIEKLSEKLEAEGLLMPPKMNWQFDNCGDNKNKEMFCYASLLIELGYFDEIDVNFLVVGHTHGSLDQNFSVLSKKIFHSPYIASPMAMRALVDTAHQDEKQRPQFHIQLQCVHDYKSFFDGIYNKSVKYYSVPHRFRFQRFMSMAICQYMLFTPMYGITGDSDWLPKVPEICALNNRFKDKELEAKVFEQHAMKDIGVAFTRLGIVDGQETFSASLELSKSLLTATEAEVKKKKAYDSILSDLYDMEVKALGRQCMRMEMQRIGDDDAEPDAVTNEKFFKADIQKRLKAVAAFRSRNKSTTSTAGNDSGLIIWLDYTRKTVLDSEFLLDRPKLLPNLDKISGELHLVGAGDEDEPAVAPSTGPVKKAAINPNAPAYKKLIANAKEIASVCRAMLKSVQLRAVSVISGKGKSIPEITRQFTQKHITEEEFEWFSRMSNEKEVIQSLVEAQGLTAEKPWLWARLSNPSPSKINANAQQLFHDRHDAIERFRALLVRKKQAHQHAQVITHEQLPSGTLNARLERNERRSCIAICPNGTPCIEVPQHECDTCHAFCCALHGPGHDKHEIFATEERLAAQAKSHSTAAPPAPSHLQFECIASTEEDRCPATGLSTCAVCNARSCSLHGPEHGKHQYWATEEALTAYFAKHTSVKPVAPAVGRPKAISKMNGEEMREELRTYGVSEADIRKNNTVNKLKTILQSVRKATKTAKSAKSAKTAPQPAAAVAVKPRKRKAAAAVERIVAAVAADDDDEDYEDD